MTEYVELEVEVLHKTQDACLILWDDGHQEQWIPFSNIENNGEDLSAGYSGNIYVAQWFAEQENLI